MRTALGADVVDLMEHSPDPQEDCAQVQMNKNGSNPPWSVEKVEWRAGELAEMLGRDTTDETNQVKTLLHEHHHAFALEEGEHGKTYLIQLSIETGDAHPIRQPLRRIPFAASHEVTRQIAAISQAEVIKPSKSPCASQVALVRKDGWLQFRNNYPPLTSFLYP